MYLSKMTVLQNTQPIKQPDYHHSSQTNTA